MYNFPKHIKISMVQIIFEIALENSYLEDANTVDEQYILLKVFWDGNVLVLLE